jgi:hypothetical protein
VTAVGDLLSEEDLASVREVRVLCRLAAATGGVVSMGANMLASDGTPVGLVAGVVAPGAFVFAAEIAARALDLPKARGTAVLRWALILLLLGSAGAAAPASFNHIRHVVAAHGEEPLGQVLIAGVVDAIAVMGLIGNHLCSIYLRRHRAALPSVTPMRTVDLAGSTAPAGVAPGPVDTTAEAETASTPSSASGGRSSRRRGAAGSSSKGREKRDRAVAVLRADPDLTLSEAARRAGVSTGTVKLAKAELRQTTPTEPTPDGPAPSGVDESTGSVPAGRELVGAAAAGGSSVNGSAPAGTGGVE